MGDVSGAAPIEQWIATPLTRDVTRALTRLARTDGVAQVAVMPDVHLAHDVCVGTVLGVTDRLFPAAVGGDIGCGMAAICFGGDAQVVDRVSASRLSYFNHHIPVSQHRSADAVLPNGLRARALSTPRLKKLERGVGRVQFGTLGRGNHFLELQRAECGRLWLMVHSGSRGLGQAICDHHTRAAETANTGLRYLLAASAEGEDYLSDTDWALEYARASRRRMVEIAARGIEKITGARPAEDSMIDCHHNFVRFERHGDHDLWVHRKGAISAREGEPGIIPGSMGSASFQVTGRGVPASLCSSSHGAGRVLSRTEARRSVSVTQLRNAMRGIWFDHRLASRLRDEAPSAYKDITSVMRAQRSLTRIVRRVEPVLSYKGG